MSHQETEDPDSDKWMAEGYFGTVSASEVDRLISRGGIINARRQDGSTPLHLAAAESSDPGVIAHLIECGAGVNERNDAGETALHWAAAKCHVPEIIVALASFGADIHACSRDGSTPLHLAAGHNGTLRVIAELIKLGADPNARDKRGATPVHRAASSNYEPRVIAVLAAFGADIDAEDDDCHSPLYKAIIDGAKPVVIAELCWMGANLNEGVGSAQGTSLRTACTSLASSEVIDELCKQGAETEVLNSELETPLLTALGGLYSDFNHGAVTALLNWGANPNVADGINRSALERAFDAYEPAAAIELLWHGAKVVGMVATWSDWEEPVSEEVLGAATESLDKFGPELLHVLASNIPEPAVIQELVRLGADVNVRTKRSDPLPFEGPYPYHETPLHLAVRHNPSPQMIAGLIQAGADVNARNSVGCTALDMAIECDLCEEAMLELIKGVAGRRYALHLLYLLKDRPIR